MRLDVYDNENGGGFVQPVTAADSVAFLQKQAEYAASLGLSIGLKNSQSILPEVSSFIQFAVNEECVFFGKCAAYEPLVASGKPVFQIEYGSPDEMSKWCANGASFSTVVMRSKEITGESFYCDGSRAVTPVNDAPDRRGHHN
jgi:Glycoside-hydrolase family GH114